MTAPTNLPAAYALPKTGSALAAGAILTRARRLFSFRIAADRPPGGIAAASVPNSSPVRTRQHLLSSFERRSTHNHRGNSSERNEVGVLFDADLVVAPGSSSLVDHRVQPSCIVPQAPELHVQSPVSQSEIVTGVQDNASHGE